jgi:hypothetical protein
MKRFITLLFALLLSVNTAFASYFPETAIKASPDAGFRTCSAFTTPVASTTDIAELYGSASKTIYVKRVLVALSYTSSGTVNPPCFLVKRSTANSSGTATTETVVPLDSNNTGTAVAKTYTANPTTGTLVGRVASTLLGTVYNPGTGSQAGYHVLYESGPDKPALVLRGTGQGVCVNFNGTKPDGGSPLVSVVFEWSEK